MGQGAFAEALSGRLKEAFPEWNVRYGGSLSEDPEALAHASGSSGVILVMEKGRSSYQDIQREAEAAEGCGVQILGFVLA